MYGQRIITITIGTYDLAWALGLLCIYSLFRPKFARLMYHTILEILRLACTLYIFYFISLPQVRTIF